MKLKIATVVTGYPSTGKIETKDRMGREGGMAICSELKIADFPGLCVGPLRTMIDSLVFAQHHVIQDCNKTFPT